MSYRDAAALAEHVERLRAENAALRARVEGRRADWINAFVPIVLWLVAVVSVSVLSWVVR